MTAIEKKEYFKQYYLKNKDKLKEKHKNWRLENPDKNKNLSKVWRENNKEYLKEYLSNPINRERHNKNQRNYTVRRPKKQDGYFVYYLPEEHYCGITNNLSGRESSHRNTENRNTENMMVLFHSMDRSIAAHHEAMFQSVLGMNGLNYKK
jgi:hypothetical protein